jgi:uncharacterized membrane protein
MINPHTLNIAAHVATGLLALLVGLIPLFSRKGGLMHRWSGRGTVGLGLVVLCSAFLAIMLFRSPGPLIAVTLTAGYQYASGLRVLALTRRGPGRVDVLLAAAGLLFASYVAVQMGQGNASWTPAIGYSTIGYLLVMAGYDLSRPLWLGAWYRIRPLDHGVKMIGFYSALLSAGAGNLFEQWQPWSQVVPSVLGVIAMVAAVAWYSARPIHIGRRLADPASH